MLPAGDPAANALLPELERFPGFAPGWFAIGRALRARHPAGARAAFARAARAEPASADAWHALGVTCQDQGDHAAAAQAFRQALAARPEHHEAAFNLGVALQEAGDMEGALHAYAAAWRARPDSFGRIAQALVSPRAGRLWLDPGDLRRDLAARV
jgi:tetratricopeptide (TPR) repeat protein